MKIFSVAAIAALYMITNDASFAWKHGGSGGVTPPTIAVLSPPSTYVGADCTLGLSPTCAPAAVSTALQGSGFAMLASGSFDEPRGMWIESNCGGSCTGLNYTISVVAGNADRAQIDHVVFYLAGTTLTVTTPIANPRTGDWGYVINLQSGGAAAGPSGGAGCNGDVTLIADIYPTNGYVRRLSRPFTLNTQGTANAGCNGAGSSTAGLIVHGSNGGNPYYVDLGGDNTNGTTLAHAFTTINKAEVTVPNGSIVMVTSGQTFLEDLPSASVTNYPPCRMTQFLPSVAQTPYTISKTSRYENNQLLKINSCSTLFDTAIFDMSKFGQFDAVVVGQTFVIRNGDISDPYGAGGPDLTSTNCTTQAATPCLYGPADGEAGAFSAIVTDNIGAFYANIDSSGASVSQTVELAGFDFIRNWKATQGSLDIISESGQATTGTSRGKTMINFIANASTGYNARGTTTLPQNMKVAAIHYCSTSQGAYTGNVGTPQGSATATFAAASTIVQLAITEATWNATISGTTMTVIGSPSTPILPGMYFTGSGVSAGTHITTMAPASQGDTTHWTITPTQTVSISTAMTEAGTNSTGGETYSNGLFLNNNEQYVLFSSGTDLTKGGIMALQAMGNNNSGSAWVGTNGSCNGVTLVANGAPWIVSNCSGGGGFAGTCDANFANATTITYGTDTHPILAAGTNPPPTVGIPAVGQTIIAFSIGHPDLGQFTAIGSTSLNYANLVLQGSSLKGVASQPFLMQPSGFKGAMTASQSTTTWTQDPMTTNTVTGGLIGSLAATFTAGSGGTPGTYATAALTGGSGSGGIAKIVIGAGGTVSSVTLTTTISDRGSGFVVGDSLSTSAGGVSGFAVAVASLDTNIAWSSSPVWTTFTPNTTAIGGIVSAGGNPKVSMASGCSSNCAVTGGTLGNSPAFTENLVVGDRISITTEPGVWQIVSVIDDKDLTVSSLGGLTSITATNQTYGKVGAAVHFTSGALSGKEFPLDTLSQATPNSILVGDASTAVATDTAYINPGFEYGDFVEWTVCAAHTGNNGTYEAVLAIPSGNTATMSQSETCGVGSTYTVGKSMVGPLYMGTIVASNTGNVSNFGIKGQIGPGGILGMAMIQSTVYGASLDYRTGAGQIVGAVDLSGSFDSVYYNSPFSTGSGAGLDAIISDGAFPPSGQLVFDTNTCLNGASTGDCPGTGTQVLLYSATTFDAGKLAGNTYKPTGGTALQTQKGIQGNAHQTNGCPIYPFSQDGRTIACGSSPVVGAEQP